MGLMRVAGAALLAAVLGAGAQPPAAPVTVRVSLDRTAVWVGDRVQYTLEFSCPESIDILPEDVAKERLPLRGGEMLTVDSSDEAADGSTIRRRRYHLVTYAVEARELTVEAFSVRYFSRRTVGASTQTAPLGEVVVPRTVVAIRSTLPDTGRLPEPRAPGALRLLPRLVRYAQPAGLALIAVALVPVALVALNVAGRLRRVRAGSPRRRSRRQHAAVIAELSALDPDSAVTRAHAFERLDRLVREHLQLHTGIPAPALTPVEIGGALASSRGAWPAESIQSVLETCERARYGPDPLSSDEWTRALTAVQRLIRGGA